MYTEDEQGIYYAAESGSSGSESLSDSSEESLESLENGGTNARDVDEGGGSIENQIEGDFDRLIGFIQDTDDVASSATIRRIWDAPSGMDVEEDFQADLRAASGIGRVRKGKGRGKGRRLGPALSHQVRALVGEGNAAYVDGNLQETIRIMTEVIRIEPRAASAWSVLATCYRELHETEKALQLSIIGAHLRHDPEEWHQLARQSQESGQAQQALYCLAKAIRLDPTNYDAIWDRASLAKELGNLPVARISYLAILKRFPHDTFVLSELRHILIELGELKLCAQLYQDALDHFTTIYPDGKVPEPASIAIDPSLTASGGAFVGHSQASSDAFTLMEILVLADLYNTLEWYEKSIKAIRAGCRWLQGRARQKYWDTCSDDREYDVEGFVREGSEDNLAIKQGFHPLDINARHRLAIARLKIGDIEEGRMHTSIILDESIVDFAPLFAEIAETYYELAMYSEARPIYEMLGSDATTSSVHVLMQAAECRRNLGDISDAIEVYEHLIATDPLNDQAKMKLAEIYEDSGHPRKALELVYQVIDSRKKRSGPPKDDSVPREDTAGPATSLFVERKKGKAKLTSSVKPRSTLTREQVLEIELQNEQQAKTWYERVTQLWDAMRSGEESAECKWLENAEKLLEMFREARHLFVSRASRPYRRVVRSSKEAHRLGREEDDEQKMASRLELEIEREKDDKEARKAQSRKAEATQFRGIHFDEWLTLAMEYAFLLTRRQQIDAAEDVLRHLMMSTAFNGQKYQDTLRLTIATCALHARRFATVLQVFRRLMLTYQFNNEIVRLFLAALASGLSPADQIVNTSFQKFVLREIRIHAAALEGNAHWTPTTQRFMITTPASGKKDPDEVEDDDGGDEPERSVKDISDGGSSRPTKNNPVMPTLYGQSLIIAKSYQSALFYLLHAYDYFPNDPLICMTLAVASLGRAMQRQSDNRNFLITQAMGFMAKYRTLRGPAVDDPRADEIEYNFGRAFQQIGLLSHTVKHYERVLDIVEKRQFSDSDFIGVSREAAYNLCLIYVTTGATSLAKAISQRWLSI
ncbi:TPR-like protein [Fomitiporia mediterranea MF3/22]|uniref:TPR-like protein n=1 Tax=Fomitiporia mediterranea (strain MF3/22) TaxID=694068 RepID=UPI0004409045|nr:TPR-like protein [Fomitiporia mediterranea MF3/22]EJD05267.1 TPR-like protein [Fomitiporia mediterranea MF3/22]